MRPVWAEFPADESTFGLEHEYMLGSSLLVVPVLDDGATSVSVYFPPGLWYDAQDNSVYHGPDTQSVAAPPEKVGSGLSCAVIGFSRQAFLIKHHL